MKPYVKKLFLLILLFFYFHQIVKLSKYHQIVKHILGLNLRLRIQPKCRITEKSRDQELNNIQLGDNVHRRSIFYFEYSWKAPNFPELCLKFPKFTLKWLKRPWKLILTSNLFMFIYNYWTANVATIHLWMQSYFQFHFIEVICILIVFFIFL